MNKTRVLQWGLIVFSWATLTMLIGNCIGRSAVDREELNRLHNTLYDFEHASDENLQVRRYECADIDFKAARYARAGASVDEINKYHAFCRTVRE